MSKLRKKKNAVYLYSKWYSNVFLATHGRISVAATVCAFYIYVGFFFSFSFVCVERPQRLVPPHISGWGSWVNIWEYLAATFPVWLIISWIYTPGGKRERKDLDTARFLFVLFIFLTDREQGEVAVELLFRGGSHVLRSASAPLGAEMPEVSSWKPVSCLFFLFFIFFRSVPYFTRSRLVNVSFLSPLGTQWIPSPCYSSLWLSLWLCVWLLSMPVSLFACALPLALTLCHISSAPKASLNCENVWFFSLARMQNDADVLLSALLDTKRLLLKTFLNVKVQAFQNLNLKKCFWGSSLVCPHSLLIQHPTHSHSLSELSYLFIWMFC